MITMEQWKSSVEKWEGIIESLKKNELVGVSGKCGFCRAVTDASGRILCGKCPLSHNRICCNDSAYATIWQLGSALGNIRYREGGGNYKNKTLYKKALPLARKILRAINKCKPKETANETL
jgi:hypothetical protein